MDRVNSTNRCASVVLTGAVFSLCAVALWSAQAVRSAASSARATSNLAYAYTNASGLLATEQNQEARLGSHPTRAELERFQTAAMTYARAILKVRKDGTASDHAVARQILPMHLLYVNGAKAAYAAVIAGHSVEAETIRAESVRPLALRLKRINGAEASAHNVQAAHNLDHLSNSINRITGVVRAACPVSAILILWMGFLILSGNRHELNARKSLLQSEQHFRSLVRNTSDVIAILESDGAIRYLSPAAERVWALNVEEFEGKNVQDLVHPEDLYLCRALFESAGLHPGINSAGEWRMQRAGGTWRHSEVIANNLFGEPGVQGILVTFRDITERKNVEERLHHQASHDALTGLPNRTAFMESLAAALDESGRRQVSVGVMFLDLDNFKVINDSLGHEAGDRLLIRISQRLLSSLRPEDAVARLGGDEFTILLRHVRDLTDLTTVAGRILERLMEPINLDGHEVFVNASIGIAVNDEHGLTAEDLLRNADAAMYAAKQNGKGAFSLFNTQMNGQAMERLAIEMDMRRALERNEFMLHYQPIIDLKDHRICEMEALVRWKHPQNGLMPPGEFIPIAEETGMIVPLGEWVLETACKQAVQWHGEYPGAPPLMMSVNLSTRQLQEACLVENVAAILKRTGMPACCLRLEVTESVMMLNPNSTILRLNELRALGISLAIDDFGTGYSSMAYLSNLPVNTLKIDRSFISHIGEKTEHRAIVRAILTMAKTMNLKVTAEGIETDEQMGELTLLKCDFGQGFLFARPLCSEDARALLAAQSECPVPISRAA